MIPEFSKLSEEEKDLMYKAPVLVSVLIAGADGNIDSTERTEAVEVAKSKQSRAREALIDYYQVVGQSFEEKFNGLLAALPQDTASRNKAIEDELSKINAILTKIDKNWSVKFHSSLKDLAKKIAEASGGILGYLSVSYEESQYLELNMIKDPSK